jgi:hypothetical protein
VPAAGGDKKRGTVEVGTLLFSLSKSSFCDCCVGLLQVPVMLFWMAAGLIDASVAASGDVKERHGSSDAKGDDNGR